MTGSARLAEGETVHAAGRAELYELKGELGLRASTLERIGVGGHLVALERLKRSSPPKGSSRPSGSVVFRASPARSASSPARTRPRVAIF